MCNAVYGLVTRMQPGLHNSYTCPSIKGVFNVCQVSAYEENPLVQYNILGTEKIGFKNLEEAVK